MNSMHFISLMNQETGHLKMLNTRFNNSHGLSDRLNKSSAYDMALLSRQVLQNVQLKSICGTVSHSSLYLDP